MSLRRSAPIGRPLGSALSLVAASVLAAACSAGPVGDADGELVIATLLPLTGESAEAGDEARLAVDDRIDEIAAASEFDRIQIRVVHTDVRTDDALLDAAIDELAANNVDVVIGPPTELQDARTSEKLASLGTVVHLPLTQPVVEQVLMMADAMIADGHQAVTLVVPVDTPASVTDALGERLSENGGALLSVVEVGSSSERYDPEAALVAADESTAVLLLGIGDPQAVVEGLTSVGAGPGDRMVYVVGNSMDVRPTVGLRVVGPLARLADRTTDRLVIAALASATTATDDPATIAGALAGIVDGDTVCSSFADCLSSLREGADVRFEGAGANSFSTDGAPTQVPYRLIAYTVEGDINEDDSRVITSG